MIVIFVILDLPKVFMKSVVMIRAMAGKLSVKVLNQDTEIYRLCSQIMKTYVDLVHLIRLKLKWLKLGDVGFLLVMMIVSLVMKMIVLLVGLAPEQNGEMDIL